jgi:hypothetical protein
MTLKLSGLRLRKIKHFKCSRVQSLARQIQSSGTEAFVNETVADELMIVSDVFDHAARLRSFDLIAAAGKKAGLGPVPAEAV